MNKPASLPLVLTFLAVSWAAFSIAPCLAATEAAQKVSEQPAAPRGEKIFNASSFMLDNGLQVIVVPNHRAPVVTQIVWYKTGAALEQPGKSGIAHFLEHLMFKGSDVVDGQSLKPGEFSRIIKSLGGEDNAFTGHDYTAYFQSAASKHLERIMRMEAGRMRGMTLAPADMESERKVILEERRQRTDNDPRAKFSEQLNALHFLNSPYGKPVIGWEKEIENLSYDEVKAFYNAWYAPNNAILIVSGDVEPQDVLTLAKEIYGSIPRQDLPPRNYTASPPLPAQPLVVLEMDMIEQPMLQQIWRVPSFNQNKQESLALQIFEDIMGGGPTSRLYKALAVDNKLVSGVGMSYSPNAWGDTTAHFYASPLPGITPNDIMKAIADQMRKVIAEGVTDQEVKESIARLQDSSIYERDSLSGPGMIIGYALTTGSTLDDVEHWPDSLKTVTASQIRGVAAKYLDPDHPPAIPPVTGYLLPKKTGGEAPATEIAP